MNALDQKKIDEETMDFFSWYRNTPYSQIKEKRKKIIEICELQPSETGRYTVFENWIRGITRVPVLAQKLINDLAGEKLDYTIPNSLRQNTVES